MSVESYGMVAKSDSPTTKDKVMATSATESSNPSLNLERALKSTPDEYLQCRDIRHLWGVSQDLHVTESGSEGDIVERHLQCSRCETIRRDRYLLYADRWGVHRLQGLGSIYTYPSDYLIPAMGAADQSREILRYEQLSRSLGGRAAIKRAAKKVAR